ncbi:MAG: type II secretion system secretin GspD [Gammaproteobacteria bacterium]
MHYPKHVLTLSLALALFAAGFLLAPSAQAAGATATSAKTKGSEITLNLKDADIRQVAQLVSSITGKNFIVDPRANGRVTVISAKPISADALFSVFLSVLEVHGLSAQPSGHNTWKIVPAVNGRQMPGYPESELSSAPGSAMITEVVQLQNVEVAQLVAALRPLMSSTAQLSAYVAANMLIISGHAGNVRRIIGLTHQLDQPMTSEFDLVKLKYAAAADVSQVLSSMLQSSTKGQLPLKIAADPRSNSILVSGSPAARLQVKALLNELDQPTGATGNTQVIYLHYAQAEDLAKILQGYVKSEQQSNGPGKGGAAAPVINIIADKDVNALIATAPPKTMLEIQQIIKDLDVRRAQVLVQGIIAELSSNAAAQLGISWAAASSNVAGLTNFPNGIVDVGQLVQAGGSTGGSSSSVPSNLASSIPGGLLFGVGRIVKDGTSFVALLNALSSDSSTNILSTPSLVTLDNKEASLVSGQQVPFVTGQYTNTSGQSSNGSNINPFQTVNRQQLGINLKIKPQINYGGDTVTLEIDVQDSSLGTTQPGTVEPSTNNREVKTTIITKDKQILVLGGLIDTQLQQSRQKVPLLGDIPIIGNLFRYQSSEKTRKNLMIFLRPIILRNEADTTAVTKPRYEQIRQLQLGRGTKVPLLPGVTPPVLPILETSPAGTSAAAEKGMLMQPAPVTGSAALAAPATTTRAAAAASSGHGDGG